MRAVSKVYPAPDQHWVGDGFPVRTVLSYRMGLEVSPFLMLDYGGPYRFQPSTEPRGVDEHPHKGFETVTVVFSGEVDHRDSGGGGGSIGPGDVQWMTAGSGLVHEEKHSAAFTSRGGEFEVCQLWVNLPAKDKHAPPGYQTLTKDTIPVVPMPFGAGSVRVIAGEYREHRGPAKTFTPLNLWVADLSADHEMTILIEDGHSLSLFVRNGNIVVNGATNIMTHELAVFERTGGEVKLKAHEDASILLMSGQVIDEPIAAYGPFVMNTQEEIRQAVVDFQAGKMGRLEPA